jgi:hypothetical protein
MISVGLYANNHQPLALDGVEITDMVMVDNIIAAEPTIGGIAAADDRFEALAPERNRPSWLIQTLSSFFTRLFGGP